jgi:hypothetical protein
MLRSREERLSREREREREREMEREVWDFVGRMVVL